MLQQSVFGLLCVLVMSTHIPNKIFWPTPKLIWTLLILAHPLGKSDSKRGWGHIPTETKTDEGFVLQKYAATVISISFLL